MSPLAINLLSKGDDFKADSIYMLNNNVERTDPYVTSLSISTNSFPNLII